MIMLHWHKRWLNITVTIYLKQIFESLQKQSNNARMNRLPFKALYNCQSNTQMRDCQASTLRLPQSFIFLQVCSVCLWNSSHIPNSVWVSVVQHYYAEPSCPFFLFLVLIQALLSISTSRTLPQKTQENPFVMSLTVQLIMDGALNHYKSSNCFKGSAFQCFLRNQFQNIINLQGDMFCAVW